MKVGKGSGLPCLIGGVGIRQVILLLLYSNFYNLLSLNRFVCDLTVA